MARVIWYISKYVTPVYAARVGARGFCLLKEFVHRGIHTVLITSDSNHLATPPVLSNSVFREVVDGVEVHWLRTYKYVRAKSLRRILSWLDFELKLFLMPKKLIQKPDVVIVSSLSLLTILNGYILKKRYDCKLVFEIRDIWPMILVETGRFSKHNPLIILLSFVEKFGYRVSDLVVGLMPNLIEHVRNVAPNTKNPVVCVPHGYDPLALMNFVPVDVEYIEKYIPTNKFIVCHAGSIGADNALDTFFQCAVLMQRNRQVHFLLVGDGYLKDGYIKKYGKLTNLTFAPSVPKTAVLSVLDKVDIVYFSAYKSPVLRFGQSLNKIVDYMLSGKPVLASYTGFPSMIDESGCGSFVEAENAIELCNEIQRYFLMPNEMREKLGMRGRRWIMEHRKYSILADNYLQAIDSLFRENN